MEDELENYIYYLEHQWSSFSGEWVKKMLQTQGPDKNCPFTDEQIERIIEYLDRHLVPPVVYCGERLDREESELSGCAFYQDMMNHFCKEVELIIAVAHTLHLTQYPDEFFEGKTGGFGLKEEENGTLTYTGVDAWQVQSVMLLSLLGNPVPTFVVNAMIRDDAESRFYFTFQEPNEGEISSIQQLCDLRLFRKEYWRHNNFFGFNIKSNIYVMPTKHNEREQRIAYRSYRAKLYGEGKYLSVV